MTVAFLRHVQIFLLTYLLYYCHFVDAELSPGARHSVDRAPVHGSHARQSAVKTSENHDPLSIIGRPVRASRRRGGIGLKSYLFDRRPSSYPSWIRATHPCRATYSGSVVGPPRRASIGRAHWESSFKNIMLSSPTFSDSYALLLGDACARCSPTVEPSVFGRLIFQHSK